MRMTASFEGMNKAAGNIYGAFARARAVAEEYPKGRFGHRAARALRPFDDNDILSCFKDAVEAGGSRVFCALHTIRIYVHRIPKRPLGKRHAPHDHKRRAYYFGAASQSAN
jgi:hypothetical protein